MADPGKIPVPSHAPDPLIFWQHHLELKASTPSARHVGHLVRAAFLGVAMGGGGRALARLLHEDGVDATKLHDLLVGVVSDEGRREALRSEKSWLETVLAPLPVEALSPEAWVQRAQAFGELVELEKGKVSPDEAKLLDLAIRMDQIDGQRAAVRARLQQLIRGDEPVTAEGRFAGTFAEKTPVVGRRVPDVLLDLIARYDAGTRAEDASLKEDKLTDSQCSALADRLQDAIERIQAGEAPLAVMSTLAKRLDALGFLETEAGTVARAFATADQITERRWSELRESMRARFGLTHGMTPPKESPLVDRLAEVKVVLAGPEELPRVLKVVFAEADEWNTWQKLEGLFTSPGFDPGRAAQLFADVFDDRARAPVLAESARTLNQPLPAPGDLSGWIERKLAVRQHLAVVASRPAPNMALHSRLESYAAALDARAEAPNSRGVSVAQRAARIASSGLQLLWGGPLLSRFAWGNLGDRDAAFVLRILAKNYVTDCRGDGVACGEPDGVRRALMRCVQGSQEKPNEALAAFVRLREELAALGVNKSRAFIFADRFFTLASLLRSEPELLVTSRATTVRR